MSLVRGLIQPGLSAVKKAPFYSAVDEALAAIKRPKGTGAEFYTELTKQPGVKKAELADRKLEQAFKAKGKITKEEAQQVLKDNPPPQVGERHLTEISDTERDNLLRDKIETSGYDSWDEVPSRVIRKWNEEIDEDLEKFGDYRTAGGQNYREILLKLPKSFTDSDANRLMYLQANFRRGELPTNELEELIALENKKQNTSPTYWSTHFLQDPNVLAHMRVQDRKGPNGEKILHVEEIQSDWHQEGRKKGYQVSQEDYANQKKQIEDKLSLLEPQLKAIGQSIYDFKLGNGSTMDDYRNLHSKSSELQRQRDELFDQSHKLDKQTKLGTPDAPFKKNWHELAMKRLLNYAAENGYDSIAITPGAEQAKRYDLSKQINTISWNKQSDGLYNIEADAVNGRPIIKKGMTEQELENTVGKEVANRIVNGVGQFANDPLFDSGKLTRGKLENLDLQVGGEGMKGFYDQILPSYLNTFGKPYGAQVQQLQIPIKHELQGLRNMGGYPEEPPLTMHNFPITPEMRESIKQKGLPLYQQVGIPTVGTGAASQMVEQKAPEQEEPEYSKGGSIAKQAALAKLKQMRAEMAPRAEAVKNIIARDQNSYLRDVVPNSLTNPEIEAEIQRMAARARASGQQEGVLPMAERDANLVKFLEESQIKDRLYRGQRRAPKADRFITTQSRATPSFTDNPDVANVYSQQLGWDIAHGPGSTSVPVHVQMKNPFDVRNLGEHITLEEFLDKLDHDLTVARSPNKIGYEDLADILGTLDHHVFKGNAKHNIDSTDNRGTFRVRSFEQLADEVNEAGRKKNIDRILYELLSDASIDTYALADSPEVVRQLKKLGYDSMIHKDVFDAGMPYYKGDPSKIGEGYDAEHIIDAYRPFEQSKIKSAIGNRGTYDIKNPDITKATGGAIAKIAKKAIPVVRAPEIIKPSGLTELKKIVQQEKGGYGARRVERAADEIPNLEKIYNDRALKDVFTSDNARALMTMNPADFEEYAARLSPRNISVPGFTGDKQRQSTEDYVKYLTSLDRFDDVPFLLINKEEQGLPLMPFISGHEGRHRNRSLVKRGEQTGLVQLLPRAELREPFPRRSQQEYIDAMRQELEMTGNKVKPESYFDDSLPKNLFIERSPIDLPDIYAKGGSVKPQVKNAVNGEVKIANNRDTMFMELSNKKLKRK
jgi:hypothetical protein